MSQKQKEAVRLACTTHGMSRSPEYNSWGNMLNRCRNENDERFADYGGRGIRVCKRWNSFEKFFSDMGMRPEGTTLDRINNDGNYSPSNCRWATTVEQQNNRRDTLLITKNGETLSIRNWARRLSLDYSTIRKRIFRSGWEPEEALAPRRWERKTI